MNTFSDVINKYQVNGVRYCTFRFYYCKENNQICGTITTISWLSQLHVHSHSLHVVNMNKIHKRFHWTSC